MLQRLTQRFPNLTASGLYTLAVSVAFWPFWTGQFLVNPWSDMRNGYPVRELAASYFRQFGGIPEWTPYLFGGMPFIANTAHGDTFYPTFLLRVVFPVDVGITLGFMLHIILAGLFTFLFLRALKLDWWPSLIGGAGYMFSGQVLSLVSPGHDGKLFVSALLPLALLALYQGVTRGEWRRYLLFAVTVALALVSPHVQLTYYLLMAAGFFWAYLVFFHQPREAAATVPWWHSALLFGGALALGFALAAVQLVPFMEYIGFSPRGAGGPNTGWEHAISYALPPDELLGTIWSGFSGETFLGTYWGRNPLKLHSEYLGVATLMLATFGLRLEGQRRMAWFLIFLAVYGLLFALGGATPFYRLPYHLLPGIKMTRAPSMIFFLVSFAAAALAALGAQALLSGRGGKPTPLIAWPVGLAAGALIAVAGGFEGLMRGLADPNKITSMGANYPHFVLDTLRALVVAVAAAGLCYALLRGKLRPTQWGPLMGLLVLLDLWSAERRFINWTPPAAESFAADAIVRTINADPTLHRLLPYADPSDNYWIAHRIRSMLGYNGQELHRYDELLGGKSAWRNLLNPVVWRLLAVKYLTTEQAVSAPGLVPAAATNPLRDYQGRDVYFYRFEEAEAYAYLVPEALKVTDEQALAVATDPRFEPRRLLLVPSDAPTGVTDLAALPEPISTPVTVAETRPGAFRAEITQPLDRAAYLFLSENWYPAWRARVDGAEAPVLRAQYTLIGVPLAAGARVIELEFHSTSYRRGMMITGITLVVLLGLVAYGWRDRLFRRKRGSAGA